MINRSNGMISSPEQPSQLFRIFSLTNQTCCNYLQQTEGLTRASGSAWHSRQKHCSECKSNIFLWKDQEHTLSEICKGYE